MWGPVVSSNRPGGQSLIRFISRRSLSNTKEPPSSVGAGVAPGSSSTTIVGKPRDDTKYSKTENLGGRIEESSSDEKTASASRPVKIKDRNRRRHAKPISTRSLPPQSTKVLSSGHPAHHFMSGGMPCDPSPPPFSLAEYGEESLYTLILLRHGESEWNKRNWYTGWCDVNLTGKGKDEARTAGRLLLENGIEIDQAFTSVLRRASFSCQMALEEADQHWVPVTKTWRLNERHYGALQGYHKDTAYQELGLDQELVMQMRRAYDVRPPRMEDTHKYWHGNDRRYQNLTVDQLERSRAESLKDAADRILPFFHSVICPSIQSGKKCLIVSHANTIRTLVKHIDNISDEDIKGMTIPTGIPLLYRLDKDLKPVDPHIELEFRYMVEPKGYTWGTSHAHGFHGVYLGDLERLQEIQRKRDATNRDWQRIVLRNIAKSLGLGDGGLDVIETRQMWWQIHQKMQTPEYGNMLLLVRMLDCLEDLMYNRKQKYITDTSYENLIQKIHLDTEGTRNQSFCHVSHGSEMIRLRR